MTEAEIIAILENAEMALDRGDSLSGTGFWKAVGAVKRSPDLSERLGERIATVDQTAFEMWARVTVPIGLGTTLAVTGTAAGLGGLAASHYLGDPWNWLVFGAGTAVVIVTTHSLGHLAVGKAMGMRFTCWFAASGARPHPGVKVDYASYLRTPARSRAWMHAAGAIVSKIVPFAAIPAALAADLPGWVTWVLVGVGFFQIATDIVWSTKTSDWKKFRREWRYAG